MNRTLTALIVILVVILGILMIRSSLSKSDLMIDPSGKKTTAPKIPLHVETWKEFTSQDGHFNIMLPSTPHHVKDKAHDPRTKELLIYNTFVAADDEGQGYMINTITFPHKVDKDDVDTTLKNVVTDIISRNTENKLNSIKEGKFKAYKAFDFSYANGDRTIHGKVFAVEDTVYMLGVIDRSSENDNGELDFFMNSFDIIREPTK
jgi:hypothetical protein